MYIGWNVQEAENVGILASLKISHFPFWFPTLKGSIREREGNGKNPFPKFGNGKGMEKIHSRNSGTGREWKKSIPEIREREGNEKNPFPKFGKGIRGLHSWEWPGKGIPAHPCRKFPVAPWSRYPKIPHAPPPPPRVFQHCWLRFFWRRLMSSTWNQCWLPAVSQ